ncbi:MAG: flavin reductase family protein [Atopobiaceae bacterium]|jgi:flavin reductase (DIM6/NTAB) family NADH-FMN oxidoreductase RutF|nr:flavin reductase family protein [Atopobiaceae bacterium]
MAKRNIGSKLALYPCPVAVIGAMAEDGKPTWTLVAHMGIMGHDHVMVSLAKAHYINSWIKEAKVLSVNVVDEGILAKADWCGMASGAKVDKSEAFSWTAGDVGAPVIDDARLVMECKVEDVYDTDGFDNFITTIANTYADEAILNDKGKPDYDAFKPVLFEMPSYTYLRTGETIAPCLSYAKAAR